MTLAEGIEVKDPDMCLQRRFLSIYYNEPISIPLVKTTEPTSAGTNESCSRGCPHLASRIEQHQHQGEALSRSLLFLDIIHRHESQRTNEIMSCVIGVDSYWEAGGRPGFENN